MLGALGEKFFLLIEQSGLAGNRIATAAQGHGECRQGNREQHAFDDDHEQSGVTGDIDLLPLDKLAEEAAVEPAAEYAPRAGEPELGVGLFLLNCTRRYQQQRAGDEVVDV